MKTVAKNVRNECDSKTSQLLHGVMVVVEFSKLLFEKFPENKITLNRLLNIVAGLFQLF